MWHKGFYIDILNVLDEVFFIVNISEDQFEGFGSELLAKDFIDKELGNVYFQ